MTACPTIFPLTFQPPLSRVSLSQLPMILTALANEVRNLSSMFLTLQKFALKEDKLELKFHDQNLTTKRDL